MVKHWKRTFISSQVSSQPASFGTFADGPQIGRVWGKGVQEHVGPLTVAAGEAMITFSSLTIPSS